MKKLLLAALALALACLPCVAGGEGETLPPARIAVAAGDTLNVSLRITAEALGGLQGELRYDPAFFETARECAFDPAFLGGSMIAMVHPLQEGGASFVYARMGGLRCLDATVLTTVLRVRADAPLGDTEMTITGFKASGTDARALDIASENLAITIAAGRTSPSPSPTPSAKPDGPEAVAIPAALSQRAWLSVTAEPDATPVPGMQTSPTPGAAVTPSEVATPTEAAVTSAPTPAPTPAPTLVPTPVPTSANRPRGAITGGGSSATPTPAPTAPVLVIGGGATPAPVGEAPTPFALVLERSKETVTLSLTASGWAAGGLQAEIAFDGARVVYESGSASFSEEMVGAALLSMANGAESGSLRLVYSSLTGVMPEGAVFTARFTVAEGEEAAFVLRGVKYTDARDGEPLSRAMADGRYAIQPVGKMEILPGDGVPEMEIDGQTPASVALDPGEKRRLTRSGMLPAETEWFSQDEAVAVVSRDGILTAVSAGRTSVYATRDGESVGVLNVCVRDKAHGFPMDIVRTTVKLDGADAWGFSSRDAELAERGLRLAFAVFAEDGSALEIEVYALAEKGVAQIPADAFLGCANLIEAEILGADIRAVRAGAFQGCAALARVLVPDTVTQIEEGAIPSWAELIPIRGREAE